jgi:hypothetical protein
LLQHVRDDPGFVRIDLRHTAFEFDLNIDSRARLKRFPQI